MCPLIPRTAIEWSINLVAAGPPRVEATGDPSGTLDAVPSPEITTAAPSDREAIAALDRRVRDTTGHPALGDAVWRDLANPGPDSIGFLARAGDRAVAYLHVARSDTFAPRHWVLGLVRDPSAETDGITIQLLAAATDHIADHGGGDATVWVFDPTPADDALLAACAFTWQRDLYQMRVPLPIDEVPKYVDGVVVRTFEPGRDEAAWLEVNNRAFGNHPDQGGWVAETLARRMAEPWFDPSLFILVFDREGLAGFNWLKVHERTDHDPRIGEIFVIGVDPSRQGQGYGRALAVDGLGRLAARGITTGMLYVAAENTGAFALYRSLGFSVHRTDRAFGTVVDAR
jgi:mycothiol synthase